MRSLGQPFSRRFRWQLSDGTSARQLFAWRSGQQPYYGRIAGQHINWRSPEHLRRDKAASGYNGKPNTAATLTQQQLHVCLPTSSVRKPNSGRIRAQTRALYGIRLLSKYSSASTLSSSSNAERQLDHHLQETIARYSGLIWPPDMVGPIGKPAGRCRACPHRLRSGHEVHPLRIVVPGNDS